MRWLAAGKLVRLYGPQHTVLDLDFGKCIKYTKYKNILNINDGANP